MEELKTLKSRPLMRLLSVLLMLCVLSFTAGATDVRVNGVNYHLNFSDMTAECAQAYQTQDNYSGNLVIPGTVKYGGNNFVVTSIGENAFYECIGFDGTLTIPNSVVSIGKNAFYGCENLTGSLKIPDSVTTISEGAFYRCTSFNGTLTLPKSLISIGNNAFSFCYNLKGALNIPNTVTYIGDGAFNHCSRFTGDLIIPNNVECVGTECFKEMMSIDGNIVVGEKVSKLGRDAFKYVWSNATILLPVTPPDLESGGASFSNDELYVREDNIESYKAQWKNNFIPLKISIAGIKPISVSNSINCNLSISAPAPYNQSSIVWTSSNAEIATVSGNNFSSKINGLKPGKTTITAHLKDDVLGIKDSSVECLVYQMVFIESSVVMQVGQSEKTELTLLPTELLEGSLIFSVGDASIATVDKNGSINAVACGKTTLKASVADNPDICAHCEIFVNGDVYVLKIGEQIGIYENMFIPGSLSDKTLKWASSDESIATVDQDGKVSAVGVGKATITATVEGKFSVEYVVYVPSLSVTTSSYSVKPGATLQLNAELVPKDLPDKTLTWRSSDESVATVDSKGVVTGVSEGTVDITVENAYGQSASVKLFSLTQSREPYVLKPGEDIAVKDVFSDENISWSSSDESVATVDQDGKVSAVGVGKATITATVEGKFSVEYVVYVPSLSVTTSSYSVKPGATLQLNAVLVPTDLPDKTLTWSSSDESVATVDSKGVVTGVSEGTVDITVENAYGQSASVKLFSLTQSREPYVLKPGEDIAVKDVFSDENISWSSSDESVATVNQDGKVVAVGVGKATITATVEGKFSVEYVVYVPSLSVTTSSYSVKPGATLQLNAVLVPTDLPDKTLTWRSSDESVATVDSKGVVTGVSEGTVDITVENAYGQSASVKLFSLTQSREPYVLKPGEDIAIKDVFSDENISWSSSDESVATVDQDGKVIAVGVGKTTITATVEGKLTVTYEIYVPSLNMTAPSNSVKPGATLQLKAVLLPTDLPDKTLTWRSSDESVATVDSKGVVTGVSDGTVDITVENAYSQTASVKLFISNLPGISLSVLDAVMKPGEERAIKIEENLSGRTAEWSSSNPEVASVDLSGNVTANKIGSATITATLDNGMSATSTIYVAQISINSSAELKVGTSHTIHPTINPAELADRKLIWTTTDENCASVSENGEVKVVGFGPVSVSVALEENEAIAATCQIVPNYEDNGISYQYNYQSNGAVIYGMPAQDSYIVRKEIAAPYNNQTKIYSVVSVALESQPANLKKVAYPEGLSNNFSSDIVKVAYDASSCEIKDGVITEPVTGELVYVTPSISGEYEISSDINIVGPDAFAFCGELTGLKIVGSSLPLAFHNATGSAPAFADCPLTELFLGRNVSYTGSPFGNNKTLSELTFGAPVTEIEENMFNGCDGIHEVTIPATVEIVGNGAFGNCNGLSQFIIEDSRNTIEIDDAFSGSTMDYLYYGRQAYRTAFWPRTLKSIEIGRYVDTLRDSEFTDMAKLYSLTIGVGVRVINENAFRSSKITKVLWLPNTPPTGYEKIAADIYYVSTEKYKFDEAVMKMSPNLSSKFMVDGLVYVFNKEASDKTCAVIDSRYNRYISALDVPDKVSYQNIEFTVEEINDYALYCNKYFESASIGDGIISIGRYSLFNCDEIKTAPYIGKSVETIGDYAFNSCFKIPSIVIPDATKYLGAWSLANCSALESCLLGSGMETIQTGCFANDVSLKQLIVPANVMTIANQVFDNCTSFAYLEISDRTKTLSMGYSKHNPDYEPSQGVIGGLATAGVPLFDYCPLKEVYIGGDITYSTSPADGYSPFYRNDYLEKVIIHNNETDISDNEFYGCRNLKEVIVGNDVIRVGDYAFSGCLSLEYFTLGSKVETIGTDAFSDCDVMKELKSYNPVPPTCGEQAMDDINIFECTLYVPKNAIEDYRTADQWKNFFHIEGMDVEAVPVESITLDPEYWTEVVGSIFRIQATVNPITADNKHIVWASEDESVATVTEGGVVTAQGVGSTVITATCGDVVAVCEVVVQPIEAEYIVIDKQKAEIIEGETLKLIATIEPADATDQTITWSSSDDEVATVDADGVVTAIKPGEATITASAINGLKAECKITVTKRTSGINTIVVEGNSIIVPEGSEVYNMQGLRVNPEGLCSGFYIVRIAGMKAIKIRVD